MDVVRLSLWDTNEQTVKIQRDISQIFEKKLQRSVSSWLHDRLSDLKNLTCGVLCEMVDELHVVLRLCSPVYQELFQKVWLSYLNTIVEIIEDPVGTGCNQF